MKTLNEENNTELSEKFSRATEKGFGESAVDCITGALAEPYAVLCHGNLIRNFNSPVKLYFPLYCLLILIQVMSGSTTRCSETMLKAKLSV